MSDDGPATAAIEVAFPDRRVASVERPSGSDYPGNEVLRVAFADGEPAAAYLKVATADDGSERIAREAVLFRYLDAHGAVTVPTVIAVGPAADPPHLATAPLPGTRLFDDLAGDENGAADPDPDSLRPLLCRLGRALAGVHAARLDRAGWIRGGDADGLDLAVDPWPTVLRERVVEPHPAPDRFADVPGRAADLIAEGAAALELSSDDRPEPTVVHGDCHLQNVHDDPLGVVDLESAKAGDPVYDLAYTEDLAIDGRPELTAAERDDLRAALRDGYRTGADAHDLPVAASGLPPGYEHRRATYRSVTFLVTVATFERWAPEADEPVDDLTEWVREEFDRRVAAARSTSPSPV
ncbi:hypothetical protein BRD18_05385 [Halobacteriales archaeon SW_7_71_33]|nr:MAG: hypothetical protein BRD18_05385 [Halobacteriales archaeon SW_7_71_33]